MSRTSPLAAALSLSLLVGCASTDPATRYTASGPHTVGYQILDADGLTLKAWYPARGEAVAVEYPVTVKLEGFPPEPQFILGTAAVDAPLSPDVEAAPLVVLSHGFALNPEWYHPLAEHLASHGFVVVGPEHTEADWASTIIETTIARPREVSAAIDRALDGPLASMVDADRIAVVGHSYGGYTALAAAGARFDPARLEARCAGIEDAFAASFFCQPFLEGLDAMADAMDLDAVPEGLWPSLADDRVDAIVAMAGDAYLFGEEGLASVEVPALFLGGTADTGTPWELGAQLGYDHVSSDLRALVALEGGEHLLPVASCETIPFLSALPEAFQDFFCSDPAWDKQVSLDLVNQFVTAFLMHVLVEEASDALDPASYAINGLDVSTTLGER